MARGLEASLWPPLSRGDSSDTAVSHEQRVPRVPGRGKEFEAGITEVLNGDGRLVEFELPTFQLASSAQVIKGVNTMWATNRKLRDDKCNN